MDDIFPVGKNFGTSKAYDLRKRDGGSDEARSETNTTGEVVEHEDVDSKAKAIKDAVVDEIKQNCKKERERLGLDTYTDHSIEVQDPVVLQKLQKYVCEKAEQLYPGLKLADAVIDDVCKSSMNEYTLQMHMLTDAQLTFEQLTSERKKITSDLHNISEMVNKLADSISSPRDISSTPGTPATLPTAQERPKGQRGGTRVGAGRPPGAKNKRKSPQDGERVAKKRKRGADEPPDDAS